VLPAVTDVSAEVSIREALWLTEVIVATTVKDEVANTVELYERVKLYSPLVVMVPRS